MKKMNYLEHKDEVKFVDLMLMRETDWQWFVDIIDDRFEVLEINSINDYLSRRKVISKIKHYFIHIVELAKDISFKNNLLNELFLICKYQSGLLSIEDVNKSIISNLGNLNLLITYVTVLINLDNQTNYLDDITLFTIYNSFKYFELKSLCLNGEKIKELFDRIKISGIDDYRKVYNSNVSFNEKKPDFKFLQSNKDKFVNVNAFNFNDLDKIDKSFEESQLIDMLNISFNGEIIPYFTNGINVYPDYRIWTEKLVDQLQKYFNSKISNFVLESINYICNGIAPTEEIQSTHTLLLFKHLEENKDNSLHYKYNNSSFSIIRKLISDGLYNATNKGQLYSLIHQVADIDEIEYLYNSNFALSKNQKSILKEYFDTLYKSIDSISNIHDLVKYLKNDSIVKNIDEKYIKKLSEKFDEYSKEYDVLITDLFNKYMLFLFDSMSNPKISKSWINIEMIRVQKKWENTTYQMCLSKMSSIGSSFELDKTIVNGFNAEIIKNPIIYANNCTISKKDDYLQLMESTSEYAIIHMVSHYIIDKTFPLTDNQVFQIEGHEIDELTLKIVKQIKKEYGYRFLNQLDDLIYVRQINDDFRKRTTMAVALFNQESELYNLLKDKINDYELISLMNPICIGHITQLFPILERYIRKMSENLGIFPFKISKKEFMKLKDPSSILREILLEIYSLSNSFESVPDILFVYNAMYNGNSLNIRNDLIHGRKYLNNEQLIFAFKNTLFALYMIIKRIEVLISD